MTTQRHTLRLSLQPRTRCVARVSSVCDPTTPAERDGGVHTLLAAPIACPQKRHVGRGINYLAFPFFSPGMTSVSRFVEKSEKSLVDEATSYFRHGTPVDAAKNKLPEKFLRLLRDRRSDGTALHDVRTLRHNLRV